MGYDYALVHLTYTLPPAILLTAIYFPLTTRLDLYKLSFLITVAVLSTIPWDSYLIRTNIWSYPPNAVLGPTIWQIPIEEVFFFVIQTYNTTLLYLLFSKPVLHSVYLVKEDKASKDGKKWQYIKFAGQALFGLAAKKGIDYIRAEGPKTYLGLILVWATPFLFMLWSLAYQFLVRLPLTNTVLPIVVPTVYLWIVDTLALKRGTWVIEQGTKTGWELWPGLEAEEAIFFFLTNCLIVFGLVAFDNAVAILNTFPIHFPKVPALPSPALLVKALLLPARTYDDDRILGLQQSVDRLRAKSRSFYLASSTFQGRLRIDLVILYSFCRVADDLIDNASSPAEAKTWVKKLRNFLDLSYGGDMKTDKGEVIRGSDKNRGAATLFAVQNFPHDAFLTLLLLPVDRLSKEPLTELLKGFEMDLSFTPSNPTGPIKSEPDLDLYGARVAGTVALLCIQLVLYHHPLPASLSETAAEAQTKRLMAAGHHMGIALQYTNIARDLPLDAVATPQPRCYLPPSWLKKEKLSPDSFLSNLVACTSSHSQDPGFFQKKLGTLRGKLLERGFEFYNKSRDVVEELPVQARGPMRVAVESYMQIARELRKELATGGLGKVGKMGRATVPRWKRVWVAWRALVGPGSSGGRE
ncbi:terpenoid synthase [Hortaea werneckii]|uniref:Bifunctional lycopene cyclase/phytoene synthase n=1 Tax=Hortaea werneckii TaxID=91943 RepID=A0A3M7IPI1_HORWE|nr:terpenoid synthase [Hortaea werneckii]KAI6936052.1 terpenoid synthase [Hortaea werneckii]KAI6974055.1 terpenoid synthase [Hortaea werneckii]KAI6996815.1 terpenoid synthase [Hortaea werneckii]KAI7041177.1 terpenoid synthase [Hortaea werneckii]